MRPCAAACVLAAAALLAAPAWAHHSAGLLYDLDKTVKVEGVVTRFSLGNPHLRIYFTRTDQDDRTTEWMAEGGSRTVLLRRGWTPDMLKHGDHVVLAANPSRDGSNIVHVTEITLADGRKLGAEDTDPAATLRLLGRPPQGAAPAEGSQ